MRGLGRPTPCLKDRYSQVFRAPAHASMESAADDVRDLRRVANSVRQVVVSLWIRQQCWIRHWPVLTQGCAGVVASLWRRPWLAVQFPFLVAALASRAAIEARRHVVVHAQRIDPAGRSRNAMPKPKMA